MPKTTPPTTKCPPRPGEHRRAAGSPRAATGRAGTAKASARRESRGVETEINLYFRHINRYELLSAEEEKELGWRVINDNDAEARQQLVNANLRLVVAIGRHYLHRGLALADVIAEGNIGLMRAVDGFDPCRGARFSTYASWWIKQAIKRSLMNARQPIHIPAYMIELIGRWKQASRQLADQLGRTPTSAELAAELSLSKSQLEYLRRAVRAHDSRPQSLHAEHGERGEGRGLTETGPRPDISVARREEMTKIERLLDTMDERHARVVRLRFGLNGREAMTLKEVGREVGLTRERVRQIEVSVLSRLRRHVGVE